MAERWTPDSWRKKPIVQVPDYPDKRRWPTVEKQLATFPPLVFAGEARNLKKALGARRQGRGFPAAGRRLRRKLRRARRQQHPRLLPRVPADGGGADLCRRLAGGEGRPHRRPVRQAALLADREARRRGTAELSRRHHQRHRLHRGGAHARSAPADRGLSPVGGDAQPAARLRARRLRQSRPACINGCSASSRTSPQSRRYSELADRISEALGFMQACGLDLESHPELRTTDFYTSHEALLLGYEQALTRVDSTDRRLVRHLRPHALDRRPHPPARPRPCRILPRHQESARPQMRAVAQGRRAAAADRHPQSRTTSPAG